MKKNAFLLWKILLLSYFKFRFFYINRKYLIFLNIYLFELVSFLGGMNQN